jgi:hypothetical protein
MNSPATGRPPGHSRLVMIAAGVLALLGALVVTAPAQAGYYGDSYYGSNPCSYRCGYRYAPEPYYRRCSACGCGRSCYSTSRPGLVYERRFVEREYVERRYGWGARHYRRPCGYYSCGGYRRPYYGYSRPYYPYGYGGVRSWRSPYGYRYEPSADRYADGYEEPPRPPLPVGDGYEADPDSYGY